MAILSRLQDQEAVVVDGLSLAAPKTKEIVQLLKAIGVAEQTCLLTTDGVDKNVFCPLEIFREWKCCRLATCTRMPCFVRSGSS